MLLVMGRVGLRLYFFGHNCEGHGVERRSETTFSTPVCV
jgi:hypothetical protein